MTGWFAGRTPRERWTLSLAGIALALALGNWLVMEPLAGHADRLRNRLDTQHALLSWLEQIAPEVTRLRRLQPAPAQAGTQSLLSVIDQSTRRAGLKKTVKRLAPESRNKVRLWLEGAPFDTLMLWLAGVNREYGIESESISVEREDKPGLVRVNLTLQRRNAAATR